MSKIIAVVSGGLDSVTMAHLLASQGHELHLVAVNYGQRHKKEIQFAEAAAARLKASFEEVDLSTLQNVFRGSSLTDASVDVPATRTPAMAGNPIFVPNRNVIILSVAFAVAVVEEAQGVSIGVMADDVGPTDTSPEFLRTFMEMERVAVRGSAHPDLDLLAPLIEMHKSAVVALGEKLGVPWTETWTCFRGETAHCGRCAACWERNKAFLEAGVKDPTVYQTRPSGGDLPSS